MKEAMREFFKSGFVVGNSYVADIRNRILSAAT